MRKATRTWRISSQRKSQDLSQDLELAEVFQVLVTLPQEMEDVCGA